MGKPHEALGFRCEEVNEDVDGSNFWHVFSFCGENQPKTFAPTLGVFCCVYVFCTPFVYSVHARHVVLKMFVCQYFGATIAFQN